MKGGREGGLVHLNSALSPALGSPLTNICGPVCSGGVILCGLRLQSSSLVAAILTVVC